MGIQIIANIDANQQILGRVSGFANFNPIGAFPELVAGDSKVIDVFLTSAGGRLNMQDFAIVRLGLGELNGRPTSGSYTLEGEQLAFDHTAAQLQTIITAEVAAATVKLVAPFVFVIDFDANGAQTLPTVDSTGLVPDSTVNVKRLIAGDGSTKERWILRIYRNPIALVSDFDALGDDGVRGALELGTEGIYRLFEGGAVQATTTAELEVTDVNGDIQTLFQIPVTVRGEVLGEGVPAVVAFDSLVTSGELPDKFTKENTVFVSKNGNDSTGARNRFDLPFLTPSAANAVMQSGDSMFVFPGNYSGQSITGVSGATYVAIDGAIGIDFVLAAGTVTIVGNFETVSVTGGTLNANRVRTTQAFVTGGTAVIESITNSGSEISGGSLRVLKCDISSAGSPLFTIEGGTFFVIEGGTARSTATNGVFLNVSANVDTNIRLRNLTLDLPTAGTDNATRGIVVGTDFTGDIQLKDLAIFTAQNGSGTAKSIDAENATDVFVQGTLNQTHAVDSDVTLIGGSAITNTGFKE